MPLHTKASVSNRALRQTIGKTELVQYSSSFQSAVACATMFLWMDKRTFCEHHKTQARKKDVQKIIKLNIQIIELI